jgi:hypothetical protein
MGEMNIDRELGNVSNLFISSAAESATPAANKLQSEIEHSDQTGEAFEVEEAVSVRKKITYPNAPDVQEHIRRCLQDFLQKDYAIKRIELQKTSDTLGPRVKKRTEEEITILLKESGAS